MNNNIYEEIIPYLNFKKFLKNLKILKENTLKE